MKEYIHITGTSVIKEYGGEKDHPVEPFVFRLLLDEIEIGYTTKNQISAIQKASENGDPIHVIIHLPK